MPSPSQLEDELFPSTTSKFKIERAHTMNRQFHRCFASTSTMFLWALFLMALTASYLSFQSFVALDFTYIDDIVKGCLGSLDTSGKSTGSGGKKRGPAPYRIFNLGNTSPVTVPTLVNILERHLKMKAKRNVVEMPGNGDVPFTHANISLARRELGYKPTTDLQT